MPNRRRGLLQVATELQHEGSVDRAGLSAGLSSVAASFAKVSDQVGAIADHAAATEGTEAGRMAGLDPEFRPTHSLTIRGEAFDRAGVAIYGARAKERFANDLAGAYEQHQADPQGLAGALDAKRQSWLAESLPEIRPELELMFDKSRFAYMRQAARAQASRIDAESRAALESELTLGMKDAQQRAYALGLDKAADEASASDIAELTRTLGRRGIDGKPLVAPAAASKLIEKTTQEIGEARLIGAYDRLPGLEAKAAFIEKFKTDFGKSEGLAATYDFDGFERLTNKMEAGLSREVTARNAAVRAAGEDIKSLAKRAEKGFPAPPEELAAIEAKVAAAGDPRTAADLQNAKGLLELQEAARSWTPAQIDGVILQGRQRMQSEGASTDQTGRLALLEGLETTMRTELKQDPLGWADRVGVLKVPPLNFSDEVEAAVSLKTRIAQADEVGARYGQEPVYLRPDEKRALSTLVAQGGEQALGLAATFAGVAGEKAPKMMAELFDAAPAVAMIGGLVAEAGPTPAARDAADGLALRKTEGFQSIAPSSKEARTQAAGLIGGALSSMPKSETAAIALANATYEIRARRQGVTEFDADLWKQGLREVLGEQTIGGDVYGGVVNQNRWFDGRGDNMIVLPSFVRQDRWREVIDALQPEDIAAAGLGAPVGENGKPVSMERLKGATLVQAGDGIYALATGDPSSPGAEGIVRTGKPGALDTFRLDLKRLAPILKARRPDLFLGGSSSSAAPTDGRSDTKVP